IKTNHMKYLKTVISILNLIAIYVNMNLYANLQILYKEIVGVHFVRTKNYVAKKHAFFVLINLLHCMKNLSIGLKKIKKNLMKYLNIATTSFISIAIYVNINLQVDLMIFQTEGGVLFVLE